jgi:hypothetical protein
MHPNLPISAGPVCLSSSGISDEEAALLIDAWHLTRQLCPHAHARFPEVIFLGRTVQPERHFQLASNVVRWASPMKIIDASSHFTRHLLQLSTKDLMAAVII